MQIVEIQDQRGITTGIKVVTHDGTVFLTRREAVDLRNEIVDFLEYHKGWD